MKIFQDSENERNFSNVKLILQSQQHVIIIIIIFKDPHIFA